jgi:hypothetical protein
MSMVVVHVASSARNILVFLGRMAEDMGHALQELSKEKKKDDDHTYSVPLCADGEYSGVQIVAAFVDVC